MDRAEVEAKLAAAETRRREAEQLLEQSAARLERLEEERGELLGRSQLAKQHIQDADAFAKRLQLELAAIEIEEARAEFETAVRERDESARRAAEAVESVVLAVEELERARARVADVHRHVTRLDREQRYSVPPEPNTFDERWHKAAPLVEAELDRRLDSQLVDAAVRSPNVLMIEELPEHLRELARQRKRELWKADRQTSSDEPDAFS